MTLPHVRGGKSPSGVAKLLRKGERRWGETEKRGAEGAKGKPSPPHGQPGVSVGLRGARWRDQAVRQGSVGVWSKADMCRRLCR